MHLESLMRGERELVTCSRAWQPCRLLTAVLALDGHDIRQALKVDSACCNLTVSPAAKLGSVPLFGCM